MAVSNDKITYRERLRRQLVTISEKLPVGGGMVEAVVSRSSPMVRIGAGVLLIAGGMLAILPVLGVWMIPLGLVILALDLPFLRPLTLKLVVNGRRWVSLRKRRLRGGD